MSTINRSPTLRSLILAMVVVASAVGTTSIWLLYRAAHVETRVEVENRAITIANMVEAVARFDQRHSAQAHPQGSAAATLGQVEEGMLLPGPAVPRGEIVFGRREGEQIVVLRAIHGQGLKEIKRVPFDGVLAQPLFRALQGQRGSGELLDYAGRQVLAGYAPIPSLGVVVTYKIEVVEVNAPFVRAGTWAAAIGVVFILLGAWVFVVLIRPLQDRMDQSERRYAAMLTASPVGVFETDLAGRCVLVNARWCELAGMSAQAAAGEGWVEALHPDDRERVFAAWRSFTEGAVPFSLEYRFRRPDGEVRWVYGQAAALVRGKGKTTGYVGTITNIDEAVQARARQIENEAHLNQAQRTAQVGSWELDLVRDKLTWSDEIFRMFEIDKERFGASYPAFLNAIHPDDRERVNQAYTQSLVDRAPYQITHRLQMPDGSIKWVEERCESIFDDSGKPLRSSGTVQDITRIKLAEEQLEQYREHLEELVAARTIDLKQAKEVAERASSAKTEFLSRISHELRTPMNAILGFSQVLEMENLTPDQNDSVREIHKAGDHLLELINELLDLSRIEAGKLAMVIGPVGASAVVSSALQLSHSAIARHRISVVNKCKAEAAVLADSTRLRQILVNLLSNAAKYNHEGGSIRIDCQARSADTLRLSVTDSGPGIAPERLAKLFQPFERLGAQYTAVDGAGIGLALSFKLAQLMGGTLGVDSTPGQGSTFWLDLPRAESVESAASVIVADAAIAAASRTKTRVLYIEDNPANLKVVEAMFRHQSDLLLLSAVSGEAGLELARRYMPDAILLDIHLPGLDGYGVLKELQADPTTRDIPVIALSADAMPIDIERGLAAGFREYLTKPIRIKELMAAVGTVLDDHQTKHYSITT